MPLGFASLPLGPAELRALAEGHYTIIDQAMRTPGLLIIQSPDEEAFGVRRSAFGETASPQRQPDGAATQDKSDAPRPTPDA